KSSFSRLARRFWSLESKLRTTSDHRLPATLNLRWRNGMRSAGTFTEIALLYALALQSRRHCRIHHQFRQAHRPLVQRLNSIADLLIIIGIVHLAQRLLQLGDPVALVARELRPGRALPRLLQSRQNGLRLVSRFDQLPPAEIFLGVIERFQDHVLDLLVSQAVAGLHLDLRFLAAALLA